MGLSQVITVWQSHFWRKRMNGILCADMDNTIIYSYKRNIGENKLNVELYNGREISFISEKTHDLLKKVSEKMTIIPTSTRTEEQYKRIDLDIGIVPYALVCNGGVLLVNGKRDREWYLEADMSKYLAAVINSMNHDRSISASLSPTEKIQKLVQKHQNGGYEYFQKLV